MALSAFFFLFFHPLSDTRTLNCVCISTFFLMGMGGAEGGRGISKYFKEIKEQMGKNMLYGGECERG